MKIKLQILLLIAMTSLFSTAFAGTDCKTVNAHVVSIMPWDDGATFINLDSTNDCGCTIATRFGFYPSDKNAKTFLAEALTAFATNRAITIYGNAGCSVHNNTASVFTVILGGGM